MAPDRITDRQRVIEELEANGWKETGESTSRWVTMEKADVPPVHVGRFGAIRVGPSPYDSQPMPIFKRTLIESWENRKKKAA